MKSEETAKEHEFCKRCGRKLRNPDARKLGYGAVCFKKMQSSGKRLFLETINEGRDSIRESNNI
jgi:hypothetical protein